MSETEKKIDDGGPAFPITEANGANSGMPGMSLRDYFAAKAMQGFLSNPDEEISDMSAQDVAHNSYNYADAMIAHRRKS